MASDGTVTITDEEGNPTVVLPQISTQTETAEPEAATAGAAAVQASAGAAGTAGSGAGSGAGATFGVLRWKGDEHIFSKQF